MASVYDMYVDDDILCEIEQKLTRIKNNLSNTTDQMVDAIQYSQDFLAGQQYEKAKGITISCTNAVHQTEKNIQYAIDYICELKDVLYEYSKCGYIVEA